MDDGQEFERFKTVINLSEFAASMGYELDRKASSRNSAVMRQGGDKVIIARNGASGHWIYFSVRDERDSGTVIDFLQRRSGRATLGHVRQALRNWIGETATRARPRPGTYAAELEPSSKDVAKVQAAFADMAAALSLPCLEERGIGADVTSSPRLSGRIYRDGRGNAIFPHRNASGLCGFEIKNRGFTGFAKGGEKGLWASNAMPDDRSAVFAETAIDAISYLALKPFVDARLFSTAGAMNPTQPELVRRVAARMREGATVILATDNDAGGDNLAEAVRQAIMAAGRSDLVIVEDRPATRGQDWNDILQARRRGQEPAFQLEP